MFDWACLAPRLQNRLAEPRSARLRLPAAASALSTPPIYTTGFLELCIKGEGGGAENQRSSPARRVYREAKRCEGDDDGDEVYGSKNVVRSLSSSPLAAMCGGARRSGRGLRADQTGSAKATNPQSSWRMSRF